MPAQFENQAQTLAAEQQQAIAKLQLSESRRHLAGMRRRERLRRKARSYIGRWWASPAFFILAVWATATHVEFPNILVAAAILAILCALIQLHAIGINQRLDALPELLSPPPSSEVQLMQSQTAVAGTESQRDSGSNWDSAGKSRSDSDDGSRGLQPTDQQSEKRVA